MKRKGAASAARVDRSQTEAVGWAASHFTHVKHADQASHAEELLCICTGNTGLSWADVLLGELPNVYIYAANNPSESIIAKRRGYATIVSHNVPPYGR